VAASYQSIEKELKNHLTPQGNPDWDFLRRKKLRELETYTGRPVVLYAADFLNTEKAKQVGAEIQIDFSDKHGLFEAINNISDRVVISSSTHRAGCPTRPSRSCRCFVTSSTTSA
jgi:hypothetical protein